jgi:hypothetical protein
MGLVGIEKSRRDLQLSFRGRKQIMKFRGSKNRVKVSGERISGFQRKKLRSTEVGAIYRGIGRFGSLDPFVSTCVSVM